MLIKSITTRSELDEFEQHNIEKAIEWTLGRRFKSDKVLSEEFIKDLHKRMYGEVWAWAGQFRKTEKNLGVPAHRIAVSLRELCDNCKFWIEKKTFPESEIALRFKHGIVSIHCFSNGNGRHSRLMADILSQVFDQSLFTWGRGNLSKAGDVRSAYLAAVKAGDKGEMGSLIKFAKS